MNTNANQNITIAVIGEKLNNIAEALKVNSEEHRNILEKLEIGKKDLREKVDNHCVRLKNVEKDIAVMTEEIKEPKQFVADVKNKIFAGFFALLVVMGMIIYATISYFDRHK